jgi:hypothetical protein
MMPCSVFKIKMNSRRGKWRVILAGVTHKNDWKGTSCALTLCGSNEFILSVHIISILESGQFLLLLNIVFKWSELKSVFCS